jgi:hypothetical protein
MDAAILVSQIQPTDCSSLNQEIGYCVEMDTEASNNNSPPNQEDENRPLIGEVDFPFEVTVAYGPMKWNIETHASDLHFSFKQVRMK